MSSQVITIGIICDRSTRHTCQQFLGQLVICDELTVWRLPIPQIYTPWWETTKHWRPAINLCLRTGDWLIDLVAVGVGHDFEWRSGRPRVDMVSAHRWHAVANFRMFVHGWSRAVAIHHNHHQRQQQQRTSRHGSRSKIKVTRRLVTVEILRLTHWQKHVKELAQLCFFLKSGFKSTYIPVVKRPCITFISVN